MWGGAKGKPNNIFKKRIGKYLYHLIGINMPMSFSKPSFGARRFRQFCAHLMLDNCGKWINIEKGVHFGENLTIGEGSGIGANSRIPGSTIIGDYVMMGKDCIFLDTNHRFDDLSVPMGAQGFQERRPIIIGNDVWIGDRVIVLPGVHVGNGCVIGAGSVVTHNIPDFEIWAGNPAHKIKSRK